MSNKISVVIRNKNQENALEFLLKNLRSRYDEDIDEIIVLDNNSKDKSQQVVSKYGARLISIEHFSYGGSANIAAESASNNIVVIFSAHAYPVSHDFFRLIRKRFEENSNLAGLRCLHNTNDYHQYINKTLSIEDPNRSGLIFCGSVFNKKVWKLHRFKDDIITFEDKEWSLRVIREGFDIELCPAIFCYDIRRTRKEIFFRYKSEVVGSYQLWHKDVSWDRTFRSLVGDLWIHSQNFFWNIVYSFKKFHFLAKIVLNRPERFER